MDIDDGTRTKLDAVGQAYGAGPMKNMLDLIGSAEAATKGYEDAFGVKGRVPVTNMSVDEVLAFQGSLKAQGSPSTAVGRYQFLNKTLSEVKKELKLTGDEKMTPELQDRMAIHLMRRRGLDQYLRGEMSKETFANRMAMEWAGLPTTSGHSYYYGDGLNKSQVPLEDFLTAVTALSTSGE